MPNEYANKIQVVRGGQTETLIDLTADTITASALMQGYTAHDASGAPITGTATGGSMVIRDEADSHGGTIRHITAGTVVTGTTSITENGSYDVAQYADAVVNVPAPAPSLQSKTATPTESQQTVTPDTGYDGLSSVSVGAISSTYVGSGIPRRSSTDITNEDNFFFTIPSGYYSEDANCWPAYAVFSWNEPYTDSYGNITASANAVTAGYASGQISNRFTLPNYVGSEITRRSSTDLTASGATVTVPSGYYAAQASKAVASGTAGTPTATKGTVSNHSVSVTPSVTNTAGYITGGTKTGTAVSVSASELVSGTLSITENGQYDVSEYAIANVNVGGGTLVTGTFTTGDTRAEKETVSINYAGSGYPLAYVVYCSSVSSNYDVSSFSVVKNTASEPSWTTSADVNNTSTATYIYKATPSIGYFSTNAASYVGAQYTASSAFNCVKFIGNGTTLGYYIGNATSTTLGLAPSTTYNYLIVYSS